MQTLLPIQIGRPVIVTRAFSDWYVSSGFDRRRLSDLHTTLAYSKKPVDWNVEPFLPQLGRLTLTEPLRELITFGKTHIVLSVPSKDLATRWQEMIDAGAAWDFETFIPHITLGSPKELIDENTTPFDQEIILGDEYRKPAK